MYFVVCLTWGEVVAECLSYDQASSCIEELVNSCNGSLWTEDDFAIMDEAELEDYGLMN